MPSGNAAATIIIPIVCSAIFCSTATRDSRSRRSPAWSVSVDPRLLPRYAGPIAEFILTHADATRYDILDFIERTWGVRVSTVALHHFCKKFGLDRATRAEATSPRPSADRTFAEPRIGETVPPSQPVPLPPPPFCRRGRNTRARSS